MIKVPYDEDFFKQYLAYQRETSVFISHNIAIETFWNFIQINSFGNFNTNILDLGCGKTLEFFQRNAKHSSLSYFASKLREGSIYVGVDQSLPDILEEDFCFFRGVQGDYRDPDVFNKYCERAMVCNIFVSLFSTEITASHLDNADLYEKLFRTIPNLEYGLVSGFYYQGKMDRTIVQETGDVESYQKLPHVHTLESEYSSEYSEMRLMIPTPSIMFGQDVVEVWRILKRQK